MNEGEAGPGSSRNIHRQDYRRRRGSLLRLQGYRAIKPFELYYGIDAVRLGAIENAAEIGGVWNVRVVAL